MKYIGVLLSLFLVVGCSKSEEAAPAPTVTVDKVLALTDAIKYYYAGDVVSTETIYTPQGINYGELLKGKKVTKVIQLQNSPLYQDYATNIKIEELEPKIFTIDKNECSILKTGQSCNITISANYTDELFTSTKTARLVLGKVDNVDLFVELFGQIRNVNITSNQYVSTYGISIDKNFNTDFAQYVIQQRKVTITNSNATKYLRNDYIVPQLVGQSPTDFYISSNECMYPLAPMSSCEIRILFKKWKTASSAPDTELKFPNIAQNYSLKYGQYVTYSPVFSAWGTCSKTEVCTGVGTQSRTITSCIKNGIDSVNIANCAGTLTQSCDSPSGNRTVNIIGGTMFQTCSQGQTAWASQSVACSEDYHDSGALNCISNNYIPTFSAYSPSTNPLTVACTGKVFGTRSIISCFREDTSTVVDNSKCVDPNPTITFNSPSGTRSVPTNSGQGTQSQSCLEGATSWITTSVTCNTDYHQSGNDCVANVYVPTYSAYSTSTVSTTTCAGSDTVTRSILSCKTQHDNQNVGLEKCTDPQPSKVVTSPAGYQVVNLYDPNIPFQVMGTQNQFCAEGATTWTAINTSCYTYYSPIGSTCEANNIGSPYVADASNVYKQSGTYAFQVIADVNTTDLKIYTDASCSSQVGQGLSSGGVNWSASATFPLNILRGVYAKSINSITQKESLCTYLFSYMYDNLPPAGTIAINEGALSTTATTIKVSFPTVSENSGSIKSALIYEDGTCSTQKSEIFYANPMDYTPSQSGTNLTLGVKLQDEAGNISSCIVSSIFYGLQVSPRYSVAPNWNDYYLAGSGSPGSACVGTESIASSTPLCIHGGDKRIVLLDQTSCDGLFMFDNLGMFTWQCQVDTVTNKAYFISTGLAAGKGLNLMIDTTDPGTPVWMPNKVFLTTSSQVITSSANIAWYSNTLNYLTLNPATTTTLSSPGIYVLRKQTVDPVELAYTQALFIDANKVGVVTMPGAFVKSNTSNLNCADLGISGSARNCLVGVGASSGTRLFTYLEGGFSGRTSDAEDSIPLLTNSPRVILLGTNTGYSLINNATIRNGTSGIFMTGASNNSIKDAILYNFVEGFGLYTNSNYNRVYLSNVFSSQNGMILNQSSGNIVSNTAFNSNSVKGLSLAATSNSNTFTQVNVSNNGINIDVASSNNNIFSQVNSTSAGANGMTMTSSSGNKVLLFNAINNGGSGLSMTSNTSNIVLNSLMLNNGTNSLAVNSGNIQHLIGQLVIFKTNVIGSTDAGLYTDGTGSNNIKYTGSLWVQDQARNCNAVNVGVTKLGISSSCSSSDLSDFTYINTGSSLSLASSFPVQVGDPFTYNDVTSLLSSPFLTSVTKNDFSFTSSMRGQCTSGLCYKYDYSLAFNDPLFRSRTDTVVGLNSVPNVISGQTCPTEVAGNKFLTNGACIIAGAWNYAYKDQATCEANAGSWGGLDGNTTSNITLAKKFLKNAFEVVDPYSPAYIPGGNHDGLCEAGESCIYSPNFGAYQGTGTLVRCNFDPQGSTVNNVGMWGHLSNGK